LAGNLAIDHTCQVLFSDVPAASNTLLYGITDYLRKQNSASITFAKKWHFYTQYCSQLNHKCLTPSKPRTRETACGKVRQRNFNYLRLPVNQRTAKQPPDSSKLQSNTEARCSLDKLIAHDPTNENALGVCFDQMSKLEALTRQSSSKGKF